jgi:hypothetical protein
MTRISCDWCKFTRTDTVKILVDDWPDVRKGERKGVLKDICTDCISERFEYIESGRLKVR